MNVNELIMNALKPLDIPVVRLKYSGHKETYIEYQEYLEMGDVFDDDQESITAHYISLNLFSKDDYTELIKKIKNNLIEAGFIRENEFETFDSNTLSFCRTMRFLIYENNN